MTPSAPRRLLLTTACIAYCVIFFVHPPHHWSESARKDWRWPATQVERALEFALNSVGVKKITSEIRFASYMVVMAGLIPFLATLAIARRPRDMGLRLPNMLGPRLTLVGVCLAFPCLYWMARSQTIGGMYLRQLKQLGWTWFGLYYLTLMLFEHWLLQGVVLGWCRVDQRWPDEIGTEPPSGSWIRKALNWLGLAQSTAGHTGGRAVLRWLGIPDGCLFPMIVSGLLFGLVHVGKDFRELLLSFPGGFAQAYLAYRTNTWLTPMTQHILTAWIAFMFMQPSA